MSSNMVTLKRKADYGEILSRFKPHEPWSQEEQSIPITKSDFFTQIIMLMVAFVRGQNLQQLAYEIFGTMCGYINRNYSAEPAKDLLAALEKNTARVGSPQSPIFLIELQGILCETGYQRCGTSTLMGFLSWFHACGVTMQEIRETLIAEYEHEKLAEKQDEEESEEDSTEELDETDSTDEDADPADDGVSEE